jgi:single-strand DNA-binding protein
MLPQVTGEFRLVDDPELKFTQGGTPLANVRLVSNSRKQVDGEWVDDKVCWLRATAWKEMATNIAESLGKGDLVTVSGRMHTDEWEDQQGNKRSAMTLTIESIGPSLRWNAHRKIEAEQRSQERPAASQSQDPWSSGSGEAPPF